MLIEEGLPLGKSVAFLPLSVCVGFPFRDIGFFTCGCPRGCCPFVSHHPYSCPSLVTWQPDPFSVVPPGFPLGFSHQGGALVGLSWEKHGRNLLSTTSQPPPYHLSASSLSVAIGRGRGLLRGLLIEGLML